MTMVLCTDMNSEIDLTGGKSLSHDWFTVDATDLPRSLLLVLHAVVDMKIQLQCFEVIMQYLIVPY